MTPKIYFAAFAAVALFASCDKTKPAVGANSATKISLEAALASEDTLNEAQRCMLHTQKYTFTEKESFDRCFAMTVTRKNGTPIVFPKEVQAELDCVGSAFRFFGDRYIVYSAGENVNIFDLETDKKLLLFTNFKDIQTNATAISPDGTKLLFVNVLYNKEARAKSDYKEDTRILIVNFDAAKFAVAGKQKFDRKVDWVNSEGSMVNSKDCVFVDNNTIKYREFHADADGFSDGKGSFVTLALGAVQ